MGGTEGRKAQRLNDDFGPEFIVVERGAQQVRTPAWPAPADYVRIVRVEDNEVKEELAYWSIDEWQKEGDDATCFGAIMATIGEVFRGVTIESTAKIIKEASDA